MLMLWYWPHWEAPRGDSDGVGNARAEGSKARREPRWRGRCMTAVCIVCEISNGEDSKVTEGQRHHCLWEVHIYQVRLLEMSSSKGICRSFGKSLD